MWGRPTLRGTLEFRILGPLEALRDGRPVVLGGPRPKAVLARLLIGAGRTVTADTLIEDVWNGRPPPTAAKTLQKYVSELRKALGDGALQTRGPGYALEGAEVDARRFEATVAAAQAKQAGGEAAAALQLADQAIAMWRGDAFADLVEAPFADAERARLDQVRLIAFEVRHAAHLDLGRPAIAAAALAEMVEAYPLREGFVALLLRALYATGRQAEALRAFDRHRRFLDEELGIDPSPELRRLEAAILRHEVPPAPPVTTGNLPHPLSSLVGRDGVSTELATDLVANRLVTLTGPGGVGKTRLALEVAHRVAADHPGGAWFADLAAVADQAGLHRAIATALAVEDQAGQSLIDTVSTVLAHRAATLLVLDNCEQISSACAAVADALLRRCAAVRILATSRVPLGVEGECVRSVPPLDDDDAVNLFTVCAGLVVAGFKVTAENRASVERVCRHLDGLPLAIELAAGQLRVVDPEALAVRLDRSIDVLQSARTAAPRQRTLLATVQWSFELLTPAAQSAFARLGVFPGSFTLDAAEAVAGTLRELRELVDHSLVARDGARYRLLDTLLLFARRQLESTEGADDARQAHAVFLIELARAAEPHFYAPDELAWRRRLQAEDHNFHAALEWAAEHEPVLAHQLAVALWPYWDIRWQERYGSQILQELVERRDGRVPDDLRAWALTAGAALVANAGEGRVAAMWAEEAASVFERAGERDGLAAAKLALGLALGNRGELDRAYQVSASAVELARESGDARRQAQALHLLGFVRLRCSDLEGAAAFHRQALELWTATGSVHGRATAFRRLAAIERARRNLEAAEQFCRDALACMEELDDSNGIAHVHLTVADLARLRGDDDQAVALYTQGLAEVRAIGDRRCIASTSKSLGAVANSRRQHGRAAAFLLDSLAVRHELGDEAGLAEALEELAVTAAATGRLPVAATLLAAARVRRDTSGAVPTAEEDQQLGSLTGLIRAGLDAEGLARASEDGVNRDSDAIVAFCHATFQPSVPEAGA